MLQCVLTWGPETYRPVIAMQHSIQNVAMCLGMGTETYRPVIAMQHSIQNVAMCLGMGTRDRQTSDSNATFNSKCCNMSWHGDRVPTDQ
jgi:hypothetical protein